MLKEDSGANWAQVVRLTATLLLVYHLVACIWMGYGAVAGYGGDGCWGPSAKLARDTFAQQYVGSIYWAFQSTMDGPSHAPKTQVQMIMTILIHLTGTAVSSIYIGVIGSHIVSANMDPITQLKKTRILSMAQYMEYLQLPAPLQDRIFDFHNRQWDRGHGLGSEEFFSELPTSLRNAVIFFINGEVVSKVPFLKRAPNELVFKLVTHLKPISVPPGEVVIEQGDMGDCMYLIAAVS